MSSRRRIQPSDTDFEYLHNIVKEFSSKNIIDAKGLLLLCKSLYPNNFKIKIIEYELAKATGNFYLAANLLGDIFQSNDTFIHTEVTSIFIGLTSSPVDLKIQKLFSALPHNLQYDIIMEYCSISFKSAAEKAEFLLNFLKEKNMQFGSSGLNHMLIVPLCEVIMDHLQTAEADLWRVSCQRSVPSILTLLKPARKRQRRLKSPPKKIKSHSIKKQQLKISEEGEEEEGEVVEEEEEEEEEEGDEDEEDITEEEDDVEKAESCKNESAVCTKKSTTRVILNVYKMMMACDLFPIVYRVRNSIKFSHSQMQTLVVNSLHFFLTFAAQMPFTPIKPTIYGFNSEACQLPPQLLVNEPAKYLRLALDMTSDLLHWSSSSASYQVLSRTDLIGELDDAFKRLEEQGSGKPSNSTASQVACLFWALFVEIGVDYVNMSKKAKCFRVPLHLTKIDELNLDCLPKDEEFGTLLSQLKTLWILRANYLCSQIITDARPKHGSKRNHKYTSPALFLVLQNSLRPQDAVSTSSCLLERIIELDLILAGAHICSLSKFVDIIAANNSTKILSIYSQQQIDCLSCLLDAVHLLLGVIKKSESFIYRLTRLKLGKENESTSWTSSSPSLAVCPLTDSEETLQLCLARLEDWLLARQSFTVDSAAICVLLHQNPFWATMTVPGVTGTGKERRKRLAQAIGHLRSHWTAAAEKNEARPLMLRWLQADFIVSPNLITQLVRIEQKMLTETNSADSAFVHECMSRIQLSRLPSSATVAALQMFLKLEMDRILTCFSLFNSTSDPTFTTVQI